MTQRNFVVLAFLLTNVAPLAAQWDSPTFFAPRPGEDLGLYGVKPEGAGWGIAAIWRQEGNLSLGVRAGLADGDIVHVGAEFYGPLDLLGPQSPLLMSWLLGVGASFDGVTQLRVPLGLSVGVDLGTQGPVQLKPYAHPRVALDVLVRNNAQGEEETDTDVNFDIDVGADAALGQSFVLRAGLTFSLSDEGRNAFGAGLAYRLPRRIAVR